MPFRSVSANAPTVTITSPITAESWAADSMNTITWNASDMDDDSLSYNVLYSPDGLEWMPIGTALTEKQIVVNAAELPDGNSAKIRVMASDGVNTTTTDSLPFSVGSKGPQVFILSPEGVEQFSRPTHYSYKVTHMTRRTDHLLRAHSNGVQTVMEI